MTPTTGRPTIDDDVVHLTVEGKHDLATWKRLLPEFLSWAYPPS